MLILSLLLHQEISRQIKLNTKDTNIKNELMYRTESNSSNADSKKTKLLELEAL